MLSGKVVRLQRVVALNNVFITCKRNKDGEFEPMAIENIVKEVLNRTGK